MPLKQTLLLGFFLALCFNESSCEDPTLYFSNNQLGLFSKSAVNHMTTSPGRNKERLRALGEACQAQQVTDLQFCSNMNGINITSKGVLYAKFIDIRGQVEFQATSDWSPSNPPSVTVSNTAACKSAFAIYGCFNAISRYECISNLQTKPRSEDVCPSICRNYMTSCLKSTDSEVNMLCGTGPDPSGCSAGSLQASAPTVTAATLGSLCVPRTASGLTTCKVLNNAQLTPDGLTIASYSDQILPDFFETILVEMAMLNTKFNMSITNLTLLASDECRAAWKAYNCLSSVDMFRCIDGAQTPLPACPSVCTAYADACYPANVRPNVVSTCIGTILFPYNPAGCVNISGGTVPGPFTTRPPSSTRTPSTTTLAASDTPSGSTPSGSTPLPDPAPAPAPGLVSTATTPSGSTPLPDPAPAPAPGQVSTATKASDAPRAAPPPLSLRSLSAAAAATAAASLLAMRSTP
jgi:hypothetical protein